MNYLTLINTIIFLILLLDNKVKANNDKLIFCLYTNGERVGAGRFKVEDINETFCTHLIYSYVGIKDDGIIKSLNPSLDLVANYGRDNIKKFNNKKHYNTKLKTLIAVGGWAASERSSRYSFLFKNEETQKRFVKSITAFILKHNFDGLTLHWTYPGLNGGNPDTDKESFSSLLKKLKPEFEKRNLMLVVMCHGLSVSIERSYDIKEVNEFVDYIFLMSYDFYGDWSDHIGIASALYLHPNELNNDLSVDSVVKTWINGGATPEKLILGIPFFGRTFTLQDEDKTEPGSSFSGPGAKTENFQAEGYISFTELCQRFLEQSWAVKWQNIQKNPYAIKNDQWVGFENARSIELKAKYIIDNNLAGAAAITLEDDDFKGVCGEKYPLLKVLNTFLRTEPLSQFEYIINVSLFKKSLIDQYRQCVYHVSDIVDVQYITEKKNIVSDITTNFWAL